MEADKWQKLDTAGGWLNDLPLLSKEEIANSPSRRDGLTAEQEAFWHRQIATLLTEVGMRCKLPSWVVYHAVQFWQHFFARRSMLRNDRYLVATACLFLCSKIDDGPKHLQHVVQTMEAVRYERQRLHDPIMPRRWEDKAWVERTKEEVLVAERAVLYTLNFAMNVPQPYSILLQWARYAQTKFIDRQQFQDLQACAWTFVNDSMRTTLALEYSSSKIAHCALWLASVVTGIPLPPVPSELVRVEGAEQGHAVSGSQESGAASTAAYCRRVGLLLEELQDIANRMFACYMVVAGAEDAARSPAPAARLLPPRTASSSGRTPPPPSAVPGERGLAVDVRPGAKPVAVLTDGMPAGLVPGVRHPGRRSSGGTGGSMVGGTTPDAARQPL